jgi:hypothetical protein
LLYFLGEKAMMKFYTEQSPFDGHDSFKLRGEMDFGNADSKTQLQISVYANRKSEAAEKAIKQIDETIEYLHKQKEKLGKI